MIYPRPFDVIYTYTQPRSRRTGRATPAAWTRTCCAEIAWPPDERPLVYVCGPTPFVESVAGTLVELGHDPARIRTERFGPTGG